MRYFAAVREAMGVAEAELQLAAAPTSLGQLLDVLDLERVHTALRDPRLRIAVNGRLLDAEAPLQLSDGDEVALLPPVTGG